MPGFQFSSNQKLALIVIIGLCAIGLSISHFRNNLIAASGGVVVKEPGQEAQVVATDSDPMQGSNNDYGKVVFQVAGCVNSPGVYSLPAGKRVMDAVATAGGTKRNADLQAINLAAKIEDGSRIYVPTISEAKTIAAPGVSPVSPASQSTSNYSKPQASPGEKFKNPGDGTVNINTADLTQLQQLPGVGPSTAQKIVEYRKQIGKFSAKEQLMDVKGIGPKKMEKMAPFITL